MSILNFKIVYFLFQCPPSAPQTPTETLDSMMPVVEESDLHHLTEKERSQILSVIRRDSILQLQVQLRAR